VESVALAHNFDIFLCNTMYDPARGMRFADSLIDKQVDGVLVMTTSLSDQFALELVRNQIPVAVLDWEPPAIDGQVGVVISSFEIGIHAAVDHLVSLGHQRFAHVGGPTHLHTSHRKRDAFFNALATHNIDKENIIVMDGNMNFDSGKAALIQIMRMTAPPTAVFAADDLTAIGLIGEARKQGLQLPRDLSVIGFSDIPLAAQISPALTTVALPRYTIGSIMMTMLLDLLSSSTHTQADPPPHSARGNAVVSSRIHGTGAPTTAVGACVKPITAHCYLVTQSVVIGYVPTPEAIRHGGYSATAASHTRLIPEAGWIMVETTQQLLTKTFHS